MCPHLTPALLPGPPVELQPHGPVVSEDREMVPGAQLHAVAGPHQARARAAVQPRAASHTGEVIHWLRGKTVRTAAAGPRCTVGDEGVLADFSYMSIFSQVYGLPAPVLIPVTHCTHQICGLNCVV